MMEVLVLPIHRPSSVGLQEHQTHVRWYVSMADLLLMDVKDTYEGYVTRTRLHDVCICSAADLVVS